MLVIVCSALSILTLHRLMRGPHLDWGGKTSLIRIHLQSQLWPEICWSALPLPGVQFLNFILPHLYQTQANLLSLVLVV